VVSTLDDYLAVSAGQLAARGRLLLGKVPRDLPPHYGGLVTTTQDRLNRAIEGFVGIVGPAGKSLPPAVRQRRFRRLVEDLDLIESVALTALDRTSGDDLVLTPLVSEICRELRYPLLSPVVTATSRQYFAIYPPFNLLLVPLTEGHFLLHLPDLYHELAHPLLAKDHENDPRTEPFRKALEYLVGEVGLHFETEISAVRRGRSPPGLVGLLTSAEFSWATSWGVEFFSDVFATCTVGPAFGWSHLHLHAKRGQPAFSFPQFGPTSHPADGARMQVIISALRRLGFAGEAKAIGERWVELVRISEPGVPPEYPRCYPSGLLDTCVATAVDAVRDIGCDLASPSMSGRIRQTLNTAWIELWERPDGYVDWEKRAVEELRAPYRRI
jgi:hypothetical protein